MCDKQSHIVVRGLPHAYWVLFIGQVVNRLGGFLLAFFPLYLTEKRGFSATDAGMIVAVYAFGLLTGSTIGGAVSDRIGRKPTMVFGMAGGAVTVMALG